MGYLYKGSRVTGQLTFQGSARIEGNVDGEIQCHGTLTIGERAEVRAKISGDVVVIRGKVEGNVVAKEKVELVAPARLFGDIDTPRLIITEGVVFDGDCTMGVARQKGGIAGSQNLNADKAAAAKTVKLHAGFREIDFVSRFIPSLHPKFIDRPIVKAVFSNWAFNCSLPDRTETKTKTPS